MASGEKPVTVSKKPLFNEVVDKACDRLMDSQVRYSIRKIQQMRDQLDEMELELDEFLSRKNGK
jgi:hypothetical protein